MLTILSGLIFFTVVIPIIPILLSELFDKNIDSTHTKHRSTSNTQPYVPLPTRITPPKWATKTEYLKSQEWQDKRDTRKLLDRYSCQMCKSTSNLEVHHITYKRLYKENMEDIVTVCRTCHQAIHDLHGYVGNTFPLIKE